MRRAPAALAALAAAATAAAPPLARSALAYAPPPPHDYEPGFELAGRALGGERAATGGAPSLAGGAIAATADGALVVDPDSGQLVRTDPDGRALASLSIGRGAAQLVYDRAAGRAYVADRERDRIAIVNVTTSGELALAASWPTPAEPYGLALSPDGATLLVTAIADRALVAIDTATGEPRWRIAVGAEPRGVAISPDGARAIVTHLSTGAVELVDLAATPHTTAPPTTAPHTTAPSTTAPSTTAPHTAPRATERALRTDLAETCTSFTHGPKSSGLSCADPEAPSYARAAFGAIFLGDSLAVVAFQRESPVPRARFAEALHYGGSALPITHHLAFLTVGARAPRQVAAQIAAAEPRALAWDARGDLLYVASLGQDRIVQIARASQQHPAAARILYLAESPEYGAEGCGADGLALADNGDLLVWCALSRSVDRITAPAALPDEYGRYVPRAERHEPVIARGPTLAPSHLTAEEHAGRVLFEQTSPVTAHDGRAACASCHLDARTDGLAWQIEGRALATPVLAGRVAHSAPYKWDGRDADLAASVASTVQRLGGNGAPAALAPIAAYLATLPAPRGPTRDPAAIARGAALFDAPDLACRGCHDGSALTDNASHAFGSAAPVDTPSLVGLAAAAPYLHDASARTLDDVLAGRGSVRGMIARPLAPAERADLEAFLATR